MHLPGSAVMIGSPPFIKNMGKSKVSVDNGRQILPKFQLVSGPRKRDHPGDLLILGKTGGGGRSVRTAGEYYFIPKQVCLLFIQEAFPFSFWIFFDQPSDEFQRAGSQTISLGNVHECTVILPGRPPSGCCKHSPVYSFSIEGLN